MSTSRSIEGVTGACEACAGRRWLLGELSVPLEHQARDRWRLLDLLALGDLELIQALGGRRREELRSRHRTFTTDASDAPGRGSVCVHDPRHPAALAGAGSPRMLEVAGGGDRLSRLLGVPAVAILGSATASDYGKAMAASLARGLSLAGICVVSVARTGIGAAAQEGVLEAGGAGVAICGNGLDVANPVAVRPLLRRIASRGCVVSELAAGVGGRRWGTIAAERIAVGLSCLAVVVEARDCAGELFPARLAHRDAKGVAAMPGRLTSPLSAGCHELLLDGASLVRDARDVLDLLCLSESRAAPEQLPGSPAERLEPRLRAVFDRVGAGADTAETICGDGEVTATLAALAELELMGLLIRGEGGRYLPRDPVPSGVAAAQTGRPRKTEPSLARWQPGLQP